MADLFRFCAGRRARVAAGVLCMVAASSAVADVHINEVAMTARGTQWVELYNPADEKGTPQAIAGFVLTNETTTKDKDQRPVVTGVRYTFPRDLPPVNPGAFVVVRFDGLGSAADEIRLDGRGNVVSATLHSQRRQVNPFTAADHAALYAGDEFSSKTSRSFVAWGSAPGEAAAHAVEAGQWSSQSATVHFNGESDDIPPGPGTPVLDGGGTLGSASNAAAAAPDLWTVYPSGTVTPGALNALPGLVLYLPADGMGTGTGNVSFSWLAEGGATTFHFQLALDDRFNAIVAERSDLDVPAYETVSTLPPATYYWRVRAVESKRSPGPWSATRSFEIEAFLADPQEDFEFIPDDGGAAGGPPPNSTLTGVVKDAYTGGPLSGVTVTLNPGGHSAVTNAGGTYTIANIPSGAYTGTASLANYNSLSGPVNMNGNATLNCTLKGKSHYAKRNGNSTPARKARKDTALLCVDGTAVPLPIIGNVIVNPGSRCNKLATDMHGGEAKHHWDGSHYDRARYGNHEANHCPYAMTQMLNWYYGGTITQDEVADWISVNDNAGNPWGFPTNPERGLRHDMGGWADKAVIWALNNAAIDQKWTKPTEAEIMAFIDADRPCGMVQCNGRNAAGKCTGSHYMVLDGYYWANKRMYVRLLNTDNNGSVDPSRRYSTQDFHSDATQQAANHRAALVVPAANATGRATNPKVSTDSDGDGIMDYDEEFRFHTNKASKDTDADKIADKVEITSYIFPSPTRQIIFLQAARPEFTEDSDGDGCKDGDEDLNRDGKFNALGGETDPFSSSSKVKPGDLNADCLIDVNDFNIIWTVFGSKAGDGLFVPQADYNGNGVIDLVDYQIWYGYYAQFNQPGP